MFVSQLVFPGRKHGVVKTVRAESRVDRTARQEHLESLVLAKMAMCYTRLQLSA